MLPRARLTEPLKVVLRAMVPMSCSDCASPAGVRNNSIKPPLVNWSFTTLRRESVYASRLPAANVTTRGVPILPSEPSRRIFDVLVKPLFKSVLVWPSTVTRQNVFNGKGVLGVSVTLCETGL